MSVGYRDEANLLTNIPLACSAEEMLGEDIRLLSHIPMLLQTCNDGPSASWCVCLFMEWLQRTLT